MLQCENVSLFPQMMLSLRMKCNIKARRPSGNDKSTIKSNENVAVALS